MGIRNERPLEFLKHFLKQTIHFLDEELSMLEYEALGIERVGRCNRRLGRTMGVNGGCYVKVVGHLFNVSLQRRSATANNRLQPAGNYNTTSQRTCKQWVLYSIDRTHFLLLTLYCYKWLCSVIMSTGVWNKISVRRMHSSNDEPAKAYIIMKF